MSVPVKGIPPLASEVKRLALDGAQFTIPPGLADRAALEAGRDLQKQLASIGEKRVIKAQGTREHIIALSKELGHKLSFRLALSGEILGFVVALS